MKGLLSARENASEGPGAEEGARPSSGLRLPLGEAAGLVWGRQPGQSRRGGPTYRPNLLIGKECGEGREAGVWPSDAMGMGTQVLPEDFALPDRSRVRMNQRSIFPLVLLLISPRPSVLVGIKRILGRLRVLRDGRVWGSTVSP